MIAMATFITPEVEGHGRHGLGDNQLTHLVFQRLTVFIKGIHGCTQGATLHLTGVHRHDGVTADIESGDVGTTADGCHQHVVTDLVHDPLVTFIRQRRAGGADRVNSTEIRILPRVNLCLLAVEEVRSTGAEEGYARLPGKSPQGTQIRIAGIAVVDADGGSQQQAADLGIPHDPARRGEPQVPVIRLQVHVQALALQPFQQGAAMAVHNGLGHAGGAGGINHPQGMVKGQLLEAHGLVMGQHI